MAADKTSGLGKIITSGLGEGAKGLAVMAGKRVLSSATERIGATTQRLTDYSENGGGPGLLGAITGKGSKGGGGKGKPLKVTNIVEQIDVGVPVRVAYDQWTRFTDFPSFMKKVEEVDQPEDTKVNWKAQIFFSHRNWESDIIEQVPDRRIVWQSKGPKGTVDGAVTFQELGSDLTRICLVLQYHPQGFFENTGNLWRAPGRRARLELKHFVRHVMTEAILHPDDIKGWRGEIHDGEVTKSPDEAEDEEQPEQQAHGDEGQRRAEPGGERADRDRADRERPRRRPAQEDESARRPARRRDPVRARSGGRE
jgi:Polyketide cyclase / dehydrase and lipid transport